VTVDGNLVSSIGTGVLVLVGVAKDDTIKEVESMATKVLRAKLWDAEAKEGEEPKRVGFFFQPLVPPLTRLLVETKCRGHWR
jgi:hypothetical protein